jgi:hypothetical protein
MSAAASKGGGIRLGGGEQLLDVLVKLQLVGRKLRGSWVLVRTRNHNWLLMNVNNNKSLAEQRARGVAVASVVHTPITYPDKLWWPEEGIAKLEAVQYYAEVAPRLLKDRFEIAFACDTDHDRHGIVTRTASRISPNPCLVAASIYLFRHRSRWRAAAAVGKRW